MSRQLTFSPNEARLRKRIQSYRSHAKHGAKNRVKLNERSKAYARNNREYHKRRWKEAKKANPEKFKAYARRALLKQRYGMTVAEHDAMLQESAGLCDLCRKPFDGKISIDHCHSTGKVRGLVHPSCNFMLGHAKDDPDVLEMGAVYLRKISE